MFGYEVLCVGSATVDHFLTIHQRFSSVHPGDKVIVDDLQTYSGGGATNAAAALSRLGVDAKVLTKLGNDHDAGYVLKDLQKYHVSNISLHHSQKNTDFATIISSAKEKDRIIYVHKGASTDLCSDDFCWREVRRAKWIYLASLMGTACGVEKEIAHDAQERNIPMLFNPSLYLAKKGKIYLRPFLRAAKVLVLNKEEAQAVLQEKNNNSAHLATHLHKLGPEIVVITNGSRRLFAYADGKIYSLMPPKVKIVHTAGAGDAFAAGLLAGIIKKYSVEDALRLGQVNASSVIQHIGCKNILLTEKEAKKWMKKFRIKVNFQRK